MRLVTVAKFRSRFFAFLSHLAYRLHRKRGGGPIAAAIIAFTVAASVDGGEHGPDLTLKIGGGDARQPLLDFAASRGWQGRGTARLLLPHLDKPSIYPKVKNLEYTQWFVSYLMLILWLRVRTASPNFPQCVAPKDGEEEGPCPFFLIGRILHIEYTPIQSQFAYCLLEGCPG